MNLPPTNPTRADIAVEYHDPLKLIPDPKNTRLHSTKQIAKLGSLIVEYGWSTPIVIDEGAMILAGHARREAALKEGIKRVPCVRLSHLDPAQKLALAIADNAMSDASTFDDALLREALLALNELNFDLELTGFDTADIDIRIEIGGVATAGAVDPADTFILPDPDDVPVSRAGDLWILGNHRLLCGDCLLEVAYTVLLGDDRAQMVFTDPPYNVPVKGHVSGLGRHQHREFLMASGELPDDQYRDLLSTTMGHAVMFSVDGSIHYMCIDWRHVRTMLEAGEGVYTELKNICVWNKTNAGMGSLYRSKHELVVVFKSGKAPHQNNVELGKRGRYRTNVWDYAGANSFGATRDADLAAHPTTKPIGLVADAIRDCSRRGAIILDPFVGSGTTILAAERTGRRAASIEIDPLYVDTAIRRWQSATGKYAVLAGDGRSFPDVARERVSANAMNDESSEQEVGQ